MYYTMKLYNTMSVLLGDLESYQTKINQNTMKSLTQLLKYAVTHKNAYLWYCEREKVLHIYSDGSNISAPKYLRRAGGNLFLFSYTKDPVKWKRNVTIHITARII